MLFSGTLYTVQPLVLMEFKLKLNFQERTNHLPFFSINIQRLA